MQRASPLCSLNSLPSFPAFLPTGHALGAPFRNRAAPAAIASHSVHLPLNRLQNFRLPLPTLHSTGKFYFFFSDSILFLICYGLLHWGFVLFFVSVVWELRKRVKVVSFIGNIWRCDTYSGFLVYLCLLLGIIFFSVMACAVACDLALAGFLLNKYCRVRILRHFT